MVARMILLAAVAASMIPPAVSAQEAAEKVAKEKSRVALEFTSNRKTAAPGELLHFAARRKVLDDTALRFPESSYYQAVLARFHLKLPDGKVIIYWPYSDHKPSMRPLGAKDFRELLPPMHSQPILTLNVPFVRPSPNWIDAETAKPVTPDLTIEGDYEAWVVYEVPIVKNAPIDAWHGRIESEKIRFTVREIPLDGRNVKPSEDQLADLDVLIRRGIGVQKAHGKLTKALQLTENEGLACHIAALLRKHQPSKDTQPYPQWWFNIHYLLAYRAYHSGALAIDGPCIEDFAAVSITVLEHAINASPSLANQRLGHKPGVDFLLAYVHGKPDEGKAIADRLRKIALQYAKISEVGTDPENHRLAHYRLWISWRTLFGLGVLHDGMRMDEAKKILGEPERHDSYVVWYYSSMMHVNPALYGETVKTAGDETVRFPNKDRPRR